MSKKGATSFLCLALAYGGTKASLARLGVRAVVLVAVALEQSVDTDAGVDERRFHYYPILFVSTAATREKLHRWVHVAYVRSL